MRKLQTSLPESSGSLKQLPDGAFLQQSSLQLCPDFEDEIIIEEVDPADFDEGWIIEDLTESIESDFEVIYVVYLEINVGF